ncbi:MipA/OmpV family protein [Halocynthiibacter styelae]|uniref:MipA/OmpV family protein n=1 Tax=Halocynthiibacter styelae TaxID=2761955 RepID=A0A8J7IX16_9RHOB|nr:MipA/OmpV family protein [Paenihalocynthiibacter styelae]MBI1493540.1 MipA/OmpV family protein [Paenihalocynthiibacter styelae]
MGITENLRNGSAAAIIVTGMVFTSANAEDNSGWDITIGAGGFVSPEYLGSDETETQAVPMLAIEWNDTFFFGPGGLEYKFLNRGDLSFSASLGYDGGRKESDSTYLTGLGDIDNGAVLGFGLEYEVGPIAPYLELNKYQSGTEGVTVQVGVQGMLPLAVLTGNARPGDMEENDRPGVALLADLSATWANDDYNQGYFGVSAAQASASGLSQYSAGAGVNTVDLELGVIVPLGDHWSLNGLASYTKIIGDAADSPIVKDDDQFSVGAFVAYTF